MWLGERCQSIAQTYQPEMPTFNLIPRALFQFPLIAKRCTGDKVGQVLEIKCGWNAGSALLNWPTNWWPGDIRTSKLDRGSKALKTYIIWALLLYWKFLFGEQIHNYRETFLFHRLTQNLLHTLQLTVFNRPSSSNLTDNHCILSKGSHFHKNAREKEWKWTFWQVFKPVCLTEGFSLGEFFQSNKFFCLSNSDSTQSRH